MAEDNSEEQRLLRRKNSSFTERLDRGGADVTLPLSYPLPELLQEKFRVNRDRGRAMSSDIITYPSVAMEEIGEYFEDVGG